MADDSQSIPDSSLINLSKYFCTDFSGVLFAYSVSFSLPSGDIQILTLALVAWNFATALRWASDAIAITCLEKDMIIIAAEWKSVNLYILNEKHYESLYSIPS